ncbi:MAG: ATP-dependent zinc metalloprotease FtsH [Anaerolineae bacterium]|nr:ATP-dependent zinc metalloprotease FtsH [Anaerolineae bacterium]
MNRRWMYLIIAAAIAAVLFTLLQPPATQDEISLKALADEISAGKVKSITINKDQLYIQRVDGTRALSRKEEDVSLLKTLSDLGVPQDKIAAVSIKVQPPGLLDNWWAILGTILPLIVVVVFFMLIMRQAQGGNNQAIQFARSRARLISGDRPAVTFDDVAGADEAKQELQEVVEFLKDPRKFAALGARIPKGVLLVGPPGTGKTLIAKAVAGEAGVPFFSISGSEFVEMFVGVGASRVRDLFDQAKRHSPCIVFIDEIDAVGRQRGAGLGGSHDEREQTLNQILVEMDGFDTDTNVIVLAATNRPDILDPALLRPGRFDRQVVMDRPDLRGRRAILEVHTRGKPLAPDVDLDVIARETPGFVGADLENLVNEAAILAARRNKKAIGMAELQEAIERVIAGPERKSRLLSKRDREIVAYHEAGHAVVMHHLPLADPVHKVSIISRGMALGYTLGLPEDDHIVIPRSKFHDEIAGLLGGRVAEELVFGDVTTGASNDLERATELARKMVKEYGMSDKLGPMTFGQKEELVFLGREIAEQRDYSEEIAQEIDQEIQNIVQNAYRRARQILTEKRDKLEALARALQEKETIEREEFLALMAA